VRVLSRLFRRLFLELLEKAFDDGQLKFFSSLQQLQDRKAFLRYLAPLRKNEWVVYAKKPFAGPQQVLDYVGRYTHRVAISNNRILNIEDDQVTFRYKDYRHGSQQKTCPYRRTSSSVASCCMCCPKDFIASATTVFLATAIA
jgi:hypothetical protein